MAWDFETDPEFQKKLDWIDEFIDNEIEPLTQLGVGIGGVKSKTYQKTVRPLQQKVKDQGLWACHLGPELGGTAHDWHDVGLCRQTVFGRSSERLGSRAKPQRPPMRSRSGFR